MRRYDLNLLVALDALLCERSVSGAARRMGIGQPAMSATLSRLRALFDDPILVRAGGGMELTARGRSMSGPLRTTLAELAVMIEPVRPFDPASTDRTFRLSGGDYVGMTLLPGLARRLSDRAPRIDLRFRYLEKDAALTALDDDELDVALLVKDDLPQRFDSEVLLEETFVGAARIGHPVLEEQLDAARFAAFDHVLVTERADESGYVDKALAGQGLARRIAITVPSAALVADVLRGTELVATLPRRAAERMVLTGAVELFELPFVTMKWSMRTVWAKRNTYDPALAWLRRELRAVAAAES